MQHLSADADLDMTVSTDSEDALVFGADVLEFSSQDCAATTDTLAAGAGTAGSYCCRPGQARQVSDGNSSAMRYRCVCPAQENRSKPNP